MLRILIISLFLLAGCSSDESAIVVDMRKVEKVEPHQSSTALTYAYLPQYSHAVSFERHRQLLRYLSHETGLDFRQIFPSTFEEHVRMVERGEIDISFTNPFVYISLAELGARAFARIVEPGGGKDFQGQIIVHRDNQTIQSLEDCRGKRWIAVDPLSAGGYLFALGHFQEHGITARDFQEIAFAPGAGGRQEKVVLAVEAGAYDFGTIRKGTLEIVADRINPDHIRILAETKAYPGWVYSARKSLDPGVLQQIASAMFSLSQDDPLEAKALSAAGMTAIIAAKDEDYQVVRVLLNQLAVEGIRP